MAETVSHKNNSRRQNLKFNWLIFFYLRTFLLNQSVYFCREVLFSIANILYVLPHQPHFSEAFRALRPFVCNPISPLFHEWIFHEIVYPPPPTQENKLRALTNESKKFLYEFLNFYNHEKIPPPRWKWMEIKLSLCDYFWTIESAQKS